MVWEKIKYRLILLIAIVISLTSCNIPRLSAITLPLIGQTPSETPYQPIPWTQTPSPLPATSTPTPPPYSLWIDPAIPEDFTAKIELPVQIGLSENRETATWQLEISQVNPDSWWIYVLVAPFPTLIDRVATTELTRAWRGKGGGPFEQIPLMMTQSTKVALAALWGEPTPSAIEILPADDLLNSAWKKGEAWAIIPFEQLTPKWKVLTIEGTSPLQRGFNPERYVLSVPIKLIGEGPRVPEFPYGNRDPQKTTILAMTGVTAMVRATAFTMEQLGITYPARDIVNWLREADITHISNEVPFAEDCPYPNPVQEGMVFCSDNRYIELLEYVGTDIIELTGDHFSDWGAEAMLHTLKLYNQRGWPYYGGGKNLEEGKQAVILTHNGNKLAFIGCNAKGSGYAHATMTNPGAVPCDFDWMVSEIERLREDGALPIATFQHFEYYTYAAQPNQVRDAERLTEAGAVIVSGSQAHQPQGFSFSHGGFIHHGLGNLFFDQLDVSTPTRQAFIDRYIFYNGRHISTELLTMWFEDYARARPMNDDERLTLLRAVFQASGW